MTPSHRPCMGEGVEVAMLAKSGEGGPNGAKVVRRAERGEAGEGGRTLGLRSSLVPRPPGSGPFCRKTGPDLTPFWGSGRFFQLFAVVRAISRDITPGQKFSYYRHSVLQPTKPPRTSPRNRGDPLRPLSVRAAAGSTGPRNASERQPKRQDRPRNQKPHPCSRKCQDSVTMGRAWVDVFRWSANIGPSSATGVRASAHAPRKPRRFGALNGVLRFCRGPQRLGNMMTCTNLDIRIISSII